MFTFLKSNKINDIKDHLRQIKQSHSSSNKILKPNQKQPIPQTPKNQYKQRISMTQGANDDQIITKRKQKQKQSIQSRIQQNYMPTFNYPQNINCSNYPSPYFTNPGNMTSLQGNQNLKNSQFFFNGFQYPSPQFMGYPMYPNMSNVGNQMKLQKINQQENQSKDKTPVKQELKNKQNKRQQRKKKKVETDQSKSSKQYDNKYEQLIEPIKDQINTLLKRKNDKQIKNMISDQVEDFEQSIPFEDFLSQLDRKLTPFKKALNLTQKIQQNHKRLIYQMNQMNKNIAILIKK